MVGKEDFEAGVYGRTLSKIMSCLSATYAKGYSQLRKDTGLNAGDFDKGLMKLEELGYVESKRLREGLGDNVFYLKRSNSETKEVAWNVPAEETFEWDVFVSHATEDKDSFVRELAQELRKRGVRVWYDEFTLRIGDSLRRSIDRGLAKSRYGVIVLSHFFFAKDWAQKELDGLVVRERHGDKVILPVWLNVDKEDVASYSTLLADRVAAKAVDGIDTVVVQLLHILKSNFSDPGHTTKQRSPEDVEEDTQPKQLTDSTRAADEEKIGPQKSTVFLYERVGDAFPGIRGLHIIDDPTEAVYRLCTLLRAPLQFGDYYPIWMIFRKGSRDIKNCEAIDSKHLLLQPYELNINKLWSEPLRLDTLG